MDSFYLAGFSIIHQWAGAVESPQAIYAGAAIFTGMRVTLIQFMLAELTRKAMPTAAGETVNSSTHVPLLRQDLWRKERENE